MRVSQIRAALCVVRCRSYSAAAASLGLSRSAVCRSVEALENELGTALFTPGAQGGLELTDAGRECLSHMQSLEEAYSNMFAAALTPSGDRRGLSVAYTDAIALNMPDTILTDFVARHDYLSLDLKALNQMAIVESVLSGGLDAGLVFTGGPFTAAGMIRAFGYPELRMTEISDNHITLLFGPESPLAAFTERGFLELADLDGTALHFKEISGDQVDITTAFLNICNSCGVHPDFRRLSVNRTNNLFGALRGGTGAVVSLLPFRRAPEGLMQLPLHYPLMDVSFTAISRRDNNSEMLKIFLRYLRSASGEGRI